MRNYLPLLLATPPLFLTMAQPAESPAPVAVRQQADTAWVDDPRPRLEQNVPGQVEEIWNSGRDAGACFIGSIREVDGRRVVQIRLATAAAFPERCTGFTRYVGAARFLRDQEDESEEELEERARTEACTMLRDHPQWAVAGTVYGLGRRLIAREGQVVEQTAEMKAWFCTWQESEDDRQRAVPGDSVVA